MDPPIRLVEETKSDVYSQPENSGFGSELGTQIHYTIELVKKRKSSYRSTKSCAICR